MNSNIMKIFILLSFFSGVFMIQAAKYQIIPIPQKLIPKNGSFKFNSKTVVLCDFNCPEEVRLAHQFVSQIQLVSGLNIPVLRNQQNLNARAIIFKLTTDSGAESYRLKVTPNFIQINAGAAAGIFYAMQTLYQLMPVEIYGNKLAHKVKWQVPCVEIVDAPRFAYRGLHLDVSRHFFSINFIKKYLDAMAIHKLNTFHWHLTDDQGWRIEIKKYPKLTQVGSIRAQTLEGYYFSNPQKFDGKPYGGFYTQDEAREIVAYAAQRFITVIPEIEMPGHSEAALASYPFLSCNNDTTIRVATNWGIFKDVFCPRDTTFRFLENVLTEIMDIFPSKFIHIGGDECPKDRWKSCSDCQQLIQKLDLKDENGLQSYFIHRIENFLNAHGRSIIGWDEILDGGLAPNATVMSWRGTAGGVEAANAGHNVIMTPVTSCYLDHYQGDPSTEPLAIGGFLPISQVYAYEPIAPELAANDKKYVLGSQANVWTEYMPNSRQVEYMVFPRLAALSEVLWSGKNQRNWNDFRGRLLTQFERYKQLDINYSKAFFNVSFQSQLTTDHQTQVFLSCDDPIAEIYYWISGKKFRYTHPIIVDKNMIINAQAFEKKIPVGKLLSKTFH